MCAYPSMRPPVWADDKGEVLFHKDLSRSFRRDFRMGEGVANAAEKLNISSAWGVNETLEVVGQEAQVWWAHLTALAGDEIWEALSLPVQYHRAALRGEYMAFRDSSQKLSGITSGVRVGEGTDVTGLNYRPMNGNLIKDRVLGEYAATRQARIAEVSAVHAHRARGACSVALRACALLRSTAAHARAHSTAARARRPSARGGRARGAPRPPRAQMLTLPSRRAARVLPHTGDERQGLRHDHDRPDQEGRGERQ